MHTRVVEDAPVSDRKLVRSSGFRTDIEGLRGVAVLLVVFYHCGVRALGGGFIGVDVFFVLSGYLITGLLVTEIQKNSRLRLADFYARRVRRLLPASAAVLLVTLLLAGILMAPSEIQFAGRAARATALYLSNMFFALNAADYFAPSAATNPMLHTWSLAVEEQFYIFWPFLIILGLQVCRSQRVLIGLLTGLTLVSFTVGVWLTACSGTFAFYGLPARAWEFGSGGLAALVPRAALRLSSSVWRLIGWVGLLLVLSAAVFISSNAGFPGWVALGPCVGTAATLLACVAAPQSGVAVPLGSGPLQFLGKLSYSWYLWHWPVLVLAAAIFPNVNWLGKCASALAALAMAVAMHRVIENPIRFHPYLVRRPMLTLSVGAALMLICFTAASVSIRFAARLSKAPVMQNITASAGDVADMPRDQCVTLGDSPTVKTCNFGSWSSYRQMVLFGDSHAIQWFDAFQRVAQEGDWKLTTVLKSGCPAADVTPPEMDVKSGANCLAWRKQALRTIISMHPALVIVGSSNTYLNDIRNPRARRVGIDEWRYGTRRMLETLTGAGLRVVVMRDVPRPPFDIPTCLARSARHRWYPGGGCEFEESTALNPLVFAAEEQASAGLANVKFMDMTDQLCRNGWCASTQDGIIAYRDDNHLTGAFARHLAPAVQGRLPM